MYMDQYIFLFLYWGQYISLSATYFDSFWRCIRVQARVHVRLPPWWRLWQFYQTEVHQSQTLTARVCVHEDLVDLSLILSSGTHTSKCKQIQWVPIPCADLLKTYICNKKYAGAIRWSFHSKKMVGIENGNCDSSKPLRWCHCCLLHQDRVECTYFSSVSYLSVPAGLCRWCYPVCAEAWWDIWFWLVRLLGSVLCW